MLGILSWLCFSLLTGIPAIICGHLSLGRLRKSPLLRGKGMAIAGLVMGYVSVAVVPVLFGILFALALPAVTGAVERGQTTQKLNSARQLHLAMHTAATDAAASGNTNIGWPADAGLNSVADVKQMLIDGGYLTAEDIEKLGLDDFLIGNVSESDPPDTIVIKPKNVDGKFMVVVKKGGDGGLYRKDQADSVAQDPPRSPAYLE